MPQSQRRFKNGRENLHAQPSGQNFLAWGRSCRVAQSIPPADPSATPDKHHLQTDTQHRQVNRADVWSETMQKNKWHQKQPHPPPKKSHFTVLSHSHWSGAEMFYLYTLSGRHLHFICVCVRVSYLRFQFRNFQVELVQMFIHKCDQCLRKHKVTHWSDTKKKTHFVDEWKIRSIKRNNAWTTVGCTAVYPPSCDSPLLQTQPMLASFGSSLKKVHLGLSLRVQDDLLWRA